MTLNTALRKGSLKVCLDPSLSGLTKKENIVSKVKRTGRAEERSSFSSIQPGRGEEKWWNISVSFEKRGSPERG